MATAPDKLTKLTNGNGNEMPDGQKLSASEMELAAFLRAAEADYDQNLSGERRELYLSLLDLEQKFTAQEIIRAFGEVQVDQPGGWTGFPKRPDVIVRILANRESAAEKQRISNIERAPNPSCPRCSGSGFERDCNRVRKCGCWAPRPKIEPRPQLSPAESDRQTLADVLKTVAKDVPNVAAKLDKPFPGSVYSTYMPSEAEIEQKKLEAEQVAAKYQPQESAQ